MTSKSSDVVFIPLLFLIQQSTLSGSRTSLLSSDLQYPCTTMERGRDKQTPSRPACRQCRARRVKCDRANNFCGPCTRLDLECSFSGGPDALDRTRAVLAGDLTSVSPEYTQAGIKRRRIRSACEPCRAVKAKCTGGNTCTRCAARGIQCVQRADASNRPWSQPACVDQTDDNTASLPTPNTARDSVVGPATSPSLDYSERQLIHAYFDHIDPTTCIFLHAPTTLRDWGSGKLDPWLLKAICASALYLQGSSESVQKLASTWMNQVQEAVCALLDSLSFPRLQALVLVVIYQLEAGNTVKAWNILALAARLAFTLRLNHERPELPPVMQEVRRRTMWMIYTFDRRLCGGLDDLTVCPISRMHDIRLPCEDRTFKRGMPSRAHYLNRDDTEQGPHDEMDIVSYLLRMYAVRDRILGYTKEVRRQNVSPAESRDRLHGLEDELAAFKATLSPDLHLTDERIEIMAHSRDASGYFMLHALWILGYLDLYRFLVPGIREAASKEAIDATPAEYTDYCQTRCLQRAIQMIDIWYRISQLRWRGSIDNLFFGVSIYQASQILYCLPHLLKGTEEGIEDIKSKLRKALELGSLSLHARFTRMGDCLRETERVVECLGQTRSSSPEPTARSNSRNHHHMPSRGSFIPRETSDSDESEEAVTTRDDGGAPNDLVEELPGEGRGGYQDFVPLVFDSSTLTFDGMRDGFMPWDPFDMQVNDYYDPELGALEFQY